MRRKGCLQQKVRRSGGLLGSVERSGKNAHVKSAFGTNKNSQICGASHSAGQGQRAQSWAAYPPDYVSNCDASGLGVCIPDA